ncbi:hypothetical protein AB0M02_44180 [Actinoplanes sp. NPDC051861]|uniref:hypothetical protein n=1 Tax=Actinoplanes sp. NPDC051861 TaxID=3155170 RepID=UPI0034217060
MTSTTATLPWIPVVITQGDAEHCALCDSILDYAFITIGAKGRGAVCEDCTDQLPEVGAPLWQLAQALDRIDSAIIDLPQQLRPGVAGVAQDTIAKILDWRIGPITDDEKTAYIATMAAQGKMLRLPGGRMVEAAEYDPGKHGPFLP